MPSVGTQCMLQRQVVKLAVTGVPRPRECKERRCLGAVTTNDPVQSGKEIVIKGYFFKPLPFAIAFTLLSAQALPQEAEKGSKAGKLAFNSNCRTCHTLKEGDNRLGPNLHSIIGRPAGSEEYAYSPALSASDIAWDAETLDRFIENPDSVIPGNKMKPYGGISDEAIRSTIVSYLSEGSSEDGDGE